MLNEKRILGIIPARAGSKRIPNKNLTIFRVNGEMDSLLGWAIRHAEGSKYIDHIVVNSDLPAMGKSGPRLKREWLDRPVYLRGDRTPMEAVIVHTLYACPGYDYGVLLQPTSPLRLVEDIDRCLEIAVKQDGVGGLTGCVSYNPYGKRNGAVYAFKVQHFMEFLSLDAAHHYEMPMERSLDIDYAWQIESGS